MTWFASGTGGFEFDSEMGRITRLCPGDDKKNVLFEGILVDDVGGGDRCWISPELEHFYERRNDATSTWRCPEELDPGTWCGDGRSATQGVFGATMSRSVEPLLGLPVESNLQWSAYSIDDSVVTAERWSVWHLVPVPHPARVHIRGLTEVVPYYPPVPKPVDSWFPVSSHRWKAGLMPPQDGCVLVAAMGEKAEDFLIVVLAEANPSETYMDAPPSGGSTCPIQVFSDVNAGFCELEHHASLETRRQLSVVIGAWGHEVERRKLVDDLDEYLSSIGPIAHRSES